jgi:hypothetical protein
MLLSPVDGESKSCFLAPPFRTEQAAQAPIRTKRRSFMTNYRRLLFPSLLTLFTAGYLMIAPATRALASSSGDSKEITTLLSDAKSESIELREDAEKMETFTRSKLSWESFAMQIMEIRDHVNKSGELLAKLNQIRETGSTWQQQAIDHITPALKELAENTKSTIEHLNENTKLLHTKETEDYCVVNYQLAKELAALVADFVDYGETSAKFAELQKKVKAR